MCSSALSSHYVKHDLLKEAGGDIDINKLIIYI